MLIKKLSYFIIALLLALPAVINAQTGSRQKIAISNGWRFIKADPADGKGLMYDVRPAVTDKNDNKVADSKPTEAIATAAADTVLKKWILPTANDFIKAPSKHHQRPKGNPGSDVSFIQNNFNDAGWELVNLPHDWAINGPFYNGEPAVVGGGMGRLPVQGIGWYRKKIDISLKDKEKIIYLDIDGAMSYSVVWINGKLAGGWPYGYNSYRLNITPYINYSGNNQVVIKLDNPNYSARWYPGAGLYRKVWLTKVNPVHIAHWVLL